MNNKNLYNTILKTISEQIKQTLSEADEIAPKKQEVIGEVYLIRCDGMNKSVLDKLASKLPAFDNYGAGSVRITCKTHDEVIKVISLLVNANVLDVDNSLGQAPRISIQKINRNSVNDSVNEEFIQPKLHYVQNSKRDKMNPRQTAKLDIITRILDGSLERDPKIIRDEIEKTHLWDDRSDARKEMDVKLIMSHTAPIEDYEMHGDFITDYKFSTDGYRNGGNYVNPLKAAERHIKWLKRHGLQISIEENKRTFIYHIHYDTKQQFEALIQWLSWHYYYVDTIHNQCPKPNRQELIDIIKSGKYISC